MLGGLTGAPQLAFVALLPVFALLTVRHARGDLSDRRFVIGMALAFTAQIYLSTEVLATGVLFGALTLAAAYLLSADRRPALRRTIVLLGVALAITGVLAAPLLYYVLFNADTLPQHALSAFPADLLSFFVPGQLVAASPDQLGGTAPSWTTGSTYLGVPLLVMVAAFGWVHRDRLAARLSVIAFLFGAIAMLGTTLYVGGTRTGVPLPWKAFAQLPFLKYAIPLRFSVFAFLAAAVIVGLWLTWRPSFARWALVAVVLVSIVPALGDAVWHSRLADVPFFRDDRSDRFLDASDRVLTIPASGRNMRWQAQADFSFRMAAGYVGQDPESYTRFPIWKKLVDAPVDPTAAQAAADSPAELRRFIAAKGVTVIVTEPGIPEPLRRLFDSLGPRPVPIDGVLLYRLRPAPGA
jgi:hypothetical protein